jgi:hypothetical protein
MDFFPGFGWNPRKKCIIKYMPRKTQPKAKAKRAQRGGDPLRDRNACKGNNYDDGEDCVLDPISLECIDTDKLFTTYEGHCFNLDTLREALSRRPINPINNREFSAETVRKILSGARVSSEPPPDKLKVIYDIEVKTPVENLCEEIQGLPPVRYSVFSQNHTARFVMVWKTLPVSEKKAITRKVIEEIRSSFPHIIRGNRDNGRPTPSMGNIDIIPHFARSTIELRCNQAQYDALIMHPFTIDIRFYHVPPESECIRMLPSNSLLYEDNDSRIHMSLQVRDVRAHRRQARI